jgi:hypothetical protein
VLKPPEMAGFGVLFVQIFFPEVSLRVAGLIQGGVFLLITCGDLVIVFGSNFFFLFAS